MGANHPRLDKVLEWYNRWLVNNSPMSELEKTVWKAIFFLSLAAASVGLALGADYALSCNSKDAMPKIKYVSYIGKNEAGEKVYNLKFTNGDYVTVADRK